MMQKKSDGNIRVIKINGKDIEIERNNGVWELYLSNDELEWLYEIKELFNAIKEAEQGDTIIIDDVVLVKQSKKENEVKKNENRKSKL